MTNSDSPMALEQTIYVTTFGSISIRCGDIVLRDSDNRMKQLWNMLLYLLVHRERVVSQEELYSVLWSQKSSDYPSNALKNLAYRIRRLLEAQGFPFAQNVLVFERGTYRLNNQLPWKMDWEAFEDWLEIAKKQPDDSPRQLGGMMHAVKLYHGHFLDRFTREAWVAALSARYKDTYAQTAEKLCEMLYQRELYPKLLSVAQLGAKLCPFQEGLQRNYIRGLAATGNQGAALKQYQSVLDAFYREMGVRPSESFYDLYQEIVSAAPVQERDLDSILQELQEQASRGAFYCEYAVFRQLYRAMARLLVRSGMTVCVVLFSLSRQREIISGDKKMWGRSMDTLLDSIRSSVRMGDVVSRVSPTQYVIALSNTDYENARLVTKRIISHYKQAHRVGSLHIDVNMRVMEPAKAPSAQAMQSEARIYEEE